MTEPSTRFRIDDRVLVNGAPPDVQQVHDNDIAEGRSGRGAELWSGLRGTVRAVYTANDYETYGSDNNRYRIDLDEDLVAADQHGWITNGYLIEEANLAPLNVSDDELAEVLASIQSAAARDAR